MTEYLQGVIVGAVGSLIASGVLALLARRRTKSLEARLKALEVEEDFLTRIGTAYRPLILAGFKCFAYGIGLSAAALVFYVVGASSALPAYFSWISFAISCALFIIVAWTSLWFAWMIHRSGDLEQVRVRAEAKRAKLTMELKGPQ